MTVVHLIDSEGMFGAEYVVFNLICALRDLGINVVFGCLSPLDTPGADLGRKLEEHDVKVIYLNEKKKISLRGLLKIYRMLKDSHADILHVHGYKATVLGGIITFFYHVQMIATYHGEASQCTDLSTYVKIENIFLTRLVHIVTVSNNIKVELERRGVSSDKISVIFNGILDPLSKGEHLNFINRLHDKNINILCMGRLIPLKRFDAVIDAFNVLYKEFPDIRLTIAGSGPMADKLHSQVMMLGLNNAVHLAGFIKNTEGLYKASDIFITFSETEGSPMVLIEAMAFSLAIISTSVGAIPDMVTNNKEAIIIPSGDCSKLIESIRYLITHPAERFRLGQEARKRFEAGYTSKIMAAHYLGLYKEMIN